MFGLPEATSVAKQLYIVATEKDIKNITPLKLMKLLYIAHGCKLAVERKALFREDVEAWKHGPVISSVYHYLKEYGYSPIDIKIEGQSDSEIRAENNSLFEFLLDNWGKLSGHQLSQLTHEENTPWDKAWNKKGGKDFFGFVIPNEDIQKYYTNFLNINPQSILLASSNYKAITVPSESIPKATDYSADKEKIIYDEVQGYLMESQKNIGEIRKNITFFLKGRVSLKIIKVIISLVALNVVLVLLLFPIYTFIYTIDVFFDSPHFLSTIINDFKKFGSLLLTNPSNYGFVVFSLITGVLAFLLAKK